MEKQKIEQIVTEELNRYDMELPNYEYDTVIARITERIVKLFAIPDVMVELACPRCGSTNTAPSDKENDAGCYECGFVWQDN